MNLQQNLNVSCEMHHELFDAYRFMFLLLLLLLLHLQPVLKTNVLILACIFYNCYYLWHIIIVVVSHWVQ